jgi:protein-disulfide isomerase
MDHHSSPANTSNPWFVATLCLLTFGLGFGVATSLNSGSRAPAAGSPTAPQGAAADNAKPASADDDYYFGKKDAPVTVVEFSDYQCPFCRRFWKDTFDDLKKDYIDTGKVKFVYRDFPLSMHPMAMPFAMAVECAHEQGNDQALAMHLAIFEDQEKGGQITPAVVPDWAKAVSGLDFNKWKTCFDANKYKDEIAKDQKDGSAAGISGTPSFWILGPNNQTKLIKGAQPLAAFQQIIDGMTK